MTNSVPLTLSITQAHGLKFVLAIFVLVALITGPIALLSFGNLTPASQILVAGSGLLLTVAFAMMGWLAFTLH